MRAVATRWGGGGHTNAAGCTIAGAARRREAQRRRRARSRHRRGHIAARSPTLGRDRGRRSAHRQALRPDVARRRRAPPPRDAASGASATPARSIPRATGLLPLVLGKATRLASLLSGSDKTYEATIRLGLDHRHRRRAMGRHRRRRGRSAGRRRRSTRRSTQFLRHVRPAAAERTPRRKSAATRPTTWRARCEPVALKPVTGHGPRLERTGRERRPGLARASRASAGFYVRALARDLGQALGCGAHLDALRRTAVGPLRRRGGAAAGRGRAAWARTWRRTSSPRPTRCRPPGGHGERRAGLNRALHGNPLGPEHLEGRCDARGGPRAGQRVRVLAADGRLVALAASRGGALHPAVVLG